MRDGNYITDCSSKKNTKEAGLLLMLQRWAQLFFSSLAVPNLRSLVFYPSAYRVQSRLKDRPGRVRKRELRKGSCHRHAPPQQQVWKQPAHMSDPGTASPTERQPCPSANKHQKLKPIQTICNMELPSWGIWTSYRAPLALLEFIDTVGLQKNN